MLETGDEILLEITPNAEEPGVLGVEGQTAGAVSEVATRRPGSSETLAGARLLRFVS
jgi:hypothetical protein